MTMRSVIRCRDCGQPLWRGDSRMRERGQVCHDRAELVAALARRNHDGGRVNRHDQDSNEEKHDD